MDIVTLQRVSKAILNTPNSSDYEILVAVNAVKAMRIPTDKMIEAGCEGNPTLWNDGTDYGFAADVANDVWLHMIDAIVGEKS